MDFGIYPPDQIRAFSDLGAKIKQIDGRFNRLLDHMISTFAQYTQLQKAGAVFERSAELGGVAAIKTPVGNARVTRQWAIANAELNGQMLFERQRNDEYDRPYWEVIWGLTIPEYEDPFSKSSGGGLRVSIDDDFGGQRRDALNTAILTIMYGIVSGPVK